MAKRRGQYTQRTGDSGHRGSGIDAVELDPPGSATADFIVATGTATMDGVVATRLLSLPVGPQTYTIVVAGAPVTDLGATLLSSPALHATLLFNASLVQIATEVNFASVSGLNANQQAISDSLHQAFTLGGGGLTPVLLGLLNTDSLAAYENALDQLSPAIVSDAQIAALYSSLGFANSLLSCRVNGTDTASIIREGQCLWAGASAVFLDQGTTSSQTGFDQTTGLFAAGAQVALDNVWRLGFGASYQQSWLETSTNAVSDGEQVQGGVALKYNAGPLLLAGVVNGGRGWYDNTRPMSFGGFAGTATSDSTIDVLNAGVRAAYVFGTPHLYWKPVLDAAVTNLDLDGFAESGGSGAALLIGSVPAWAQDKPAEIGMGVFTFTSGPAAAYGMPGRNAAELMIDQINAAGGLNGKQIEVVSYDTQSDMALYTQYAQQLTRKDKTDVVHGGILSASREAIRQILRKANMPYFYNVLYEGGVCDRNIVVTGVTPAQQVEGLVPAAIEKWGKKVYILAADYNYGQITARWMEKYAKDAGGEAVSGDFFPLDVADDDQCDAAIAVAIAAIASLILLHITGLTLIAAALLATLACAAIAKAKINGQTGDILGATQQISEIAMLLTLAALLS